MLHVEKLTLYHRQTNQLLCEAISFVIRSGDKVALIGEEGNGKSTLLKSILNPALVSDYIELEGSIRNHFAKTVYLPQQLDSAICKKTIAEYVFEMPHSMELDFDLLYQLAPSLQWDSQKLSSEQRIATLSGGEKVKLQLLVLLAQNPDLLLLDEPSNDLDMKTVHWLAHWIKSARQTILFISHDETLLTKTASRVILLDSIHHKKVVRAVVANTDYATFVKDRDAAFEKQTQIARTELAHHAHKEEQLQSARNKAHHNLNTVSRQSPYIAARLKKRMHTIKAMEKRYDREKGELTEIPIREEAILVKLRCSTPLPSQKVIVNYENELLTIGDCVLIPNFSLLVRGKDKLLLTGANGIGKTTLLKKIYNDLRHRTDLRVGYMPQDYMEQLPLEKSPIEFLTKTGDTEEKTKIMTYLGSIRFSKEEMRLPIHRLSGGQKAKLFLVKLDLEDCNVLLVDEPTRNFSPLSQPEVREIFREFPGCLIAVSHDEEFVQAVSGRVVEVSREGVREGSS